MTTPIALRIDDPNRSWESNSDDDLTCKEPSEGLCVCAQADGRQAAPTSGVEGPHAEAHVEDGDLYAGAYFLSGRDAVSGVEVEVFSASIHEGADERAVQVGIARIGGSTDDGHFGVHGEAFTLQAHAGIHNEDGSTGFGASVGATLVGGDVTGTVGPVSLTAGASIGANVGASLGVRDGDGDGKQEVCGRVAFGVGTVGLCVEKWW